MADVKKYYWIKLKRDFFKRHDIRIVESLQNGKDYILFYLKLLLESIDHNGELRFSDTIPYDDQMLSVITNTNIDIVRSARKIFTELGMMEVFDDNTLYMREVEKLIGSETNYAEKKRRQRARQKLAQGDIVHLEEDNVSHHEGHRYPEIEIDIEKEKDKKIKTSFDLFWEAYPRKVGKQAAAKAFAKVKVPVDKLIAAVEAQKRSKDWQKDGGQYIPHPTTWLNQGRWEDEVEAAAVAEPEEDDLAGIF